MTYPTLTCAKCGYSLLGIPSDGNCPECGETVLTSFRVDQKNRSRWKLRLACLLFCALLCIVRDVFWVVFLLTDNRVEAMLIPFLLSLPCELLIHPLLYLAQNPINTLHPLFSFTNGRIWWIAMCVTGLLGLTIAYTAPSVAELLFVAYVVFRTLTWICALLWVDQMPGSSIPILGFPFSLSRLAIIVTAVLPILGMVLVALKFLPTQIQWDAFQAHITFTGYGISILGSLIVTAACLHTLSSPTKTPA